MTQTMEKRMPSLLHPSAGPTRAHLINALMDKRRIPMVQAAREADVVAAELREMISEEALSSAA